MVRQSYFFTFWFANTVYLNGYFTSFKFFSIDELFTLLLNPSHVEWVYKNGDSGQQYLSIVYVNGIRKQWLFYPDYIIKTTYGNIWIIETKGGM